MRCARVPIVNVIKKRDVNWPWDEIADNGKEKNLSSTTFIPNTVYSCLLGKNRRDYSI